MPNADTVSCWEDWSGGPAHSDVSWKRTDFLKSANDELGWLGISESKIHDWRRPYGRANQHNHHVPRMFWLTEAKRETLLGFLQ